MPSTLAVAKLDQELVTMHRREDQLVMALEPVYGDYDAIVLDLSPNLGQLVITALNSAEWLIVPTDASKWGRRGVNMFLEWSATLRKHQVLSAHLLGVLLTKYEPQTVISRDTLAALQDDGLPLFDTIVPKRTAAERMVSEQLVLGDPEADEDLSRAYAELHGRGDDPGGRGSQESRKASCLKKTSAPLFWACCPRPVRRPAGPRWWPMSRRRNRVLRRW